ncbi:mechanosensitive ion channel family protein [Rubellicoccus peritrichatus]|uniref:Mechanosensitive ion channel family protein n=1 Tax=Rubellicoccus peritrichatus TaxID=3080537 RepID=A0AAQ3LAA4_9BACT|nr:mechanosensitive ion channel family protein [Puniceicoccus sp. CR14]WOO40839.1 mechanosensitive ion channel family protein [Puniceicoccus sp. CR14]
MKLRFYYILCLQTALFFSGDLFSKDNTEVGENSSLHDNYEPLRPANTASPRDTLRSFLEDYSVALKESRETGRLTSRTGLAAYDRALQTLNFSTTRDGAARTIQAQRLIYLKEILDRLELPPYDEIPGPEEVREMGLREWVIPKTQMRIVFEENGPAPGTWRFSPRTVELLPRYFRQAKVLPYQPGATEGLHEATENHSKRVMSSEAEVGFRLREANIESPRDTLDTFLINMNQAYELTMQANEMLREDRNQFTDEEIESLDNKINDSLRRAVETLNLSQVAKALRNDVGLESAMQIKEIMDRMGLPPIDMIPDIHMVEDLRKQMHNEGQPIRWTYPNTNIEIVEVMEGDLKGFFLFSSRTIDQAAESYEKVKDIEYRPDSDVYYHFKSKYESPNISPGFYEFYVSTPGNMIPQATPLGRFVENLPDSFHKSFLGQSLWHWVFTLVTYLLALVVSVIIFVGIGRFGANRSMLLKSWLKLFPPLLVSLLIFFATIFITDYINITGTPIFTIINIDGVVRSALLAWAVFCLCRALTETVIALPQIKDESVDASLLRLTSRIIGVLLLLWVLLAGLKDLGLDIWPLIAGLGVGGLAVALAFRPTMENIIGSFMIFADKPYKIGQRVKVLGADGTVESIGLRSTKIRLLSGHITTIPNEKMTTVAIENVGQRPYIRRVFDVTITYDTKPKQINRAVEIIRDILSVPDDQVADRMATAEEKSVHPNTAINKPDFPPRVFFNNLNSDSLNILVIYWYHPPEYWEFLEHANWVNVQIMEQFNAEGIDFAFPTQTLHLAGDPNRELSVGTHWETDEKGQSAINLFSQAAAFGAQSALGNVSFATASDEIRPENRQLNPEKENKSGDTSDAAIEDDIVDPDNNSQQQ